MKVKIIGKRERIGKREKYRGKGERKKSIDD